MRGDCYMMIEADMGILLPQTKKYLRLSAAGRAKKDSSPTIYRRNMSL